MTSFSLIETYTGDGSAYLHGITGFGTGGTAPVPLIYTAGSFGGGISVYTANSFNGLTLLDRQSYHASTPAFSQAALVPVSLGGQPTLLALTPQGGGYSAYRLDSSGMLTGARIAVSVTGPAPDHPLDAVATGTHLFVAQSDGGVARFAYSASGVMTHLSETGGGTVSRLAMTEIGGTEFLLAAETQENALAVYRIGTNGSLTLTARTGAAEGLGIGTPTAIATATLGGETFALLGAASGGTVTVFALDPAGGLEARDMAADIALTRLNGMTSLTAVTWNGAVFVVAGGADDGLTLLRLLPGGRLVHLASVADALDSTLDNVTGLAATATATGLLVTAASATETGLSIFGVDLTAQGTAIQGLGTGVEQAGAALDDWFVSSAGTDRFRGGAGADTFIFRNDGSCDIVLDYTPGEDRLDLSGIPFLYTLMQMTLTPTATGAFLSFGGFEVELRSAAGTTLGEADITLESSLHHPYLGNMPEVPHTVFGTSGSDSLQGTLTDDLLRGLSGDDLLLASRGQDTLDGGAGHDIADFGAADGRVLIDLATDVSQAAFAAHFAWGATQHLAYLDMEEFRGGAFADNLRGDASANLLRGGGVSDRIYGRGGNDTLDGGAGADALYGNAGADLLIGGNDTRRDRFIYFQWQDSPAGQHDTIQDFTPGIDRIEISRLDADLLSDGKQSFQFIGTQGFSGQAGQLRFGSTGMGDTLVQADLDGDALADFAILLTGSMALTQTDFLL